MPRVPQDVVDRIKQVPMRQVLERMYGPEILASERKKLGKIICPYHTERTPSFHIKNGDNIFKCFGCGRGGDVITAVQLSRNCGFYEALRYLSTNFFDSDSKISGYFDRSYKGNSDFSRGDFDEPKEPSEEVRRKRPDVVYDLDSPLRDLVVDVLGKSQDYFSAQLDSNKSAEAEAARDYLHSRELFGNVRGTWKFGFAPNNDVLFTRLLQEYPGEDETGESFFDVLRYAGLVNEKGFRILGNRITFPVRTVSGEVIGFFGRKIENGGSRAKYKNGPRSVVFDKERTLFGLDNLDPDQVRSEGLYLVEGMTDLVGFVEQGVNCALSLGSTRLTESQTGLVSYFNPPTVYIVCDGDGAGVSGSIANANRLIGTLDRGVDVKIVSMPQGQDPFDLFHLARRPGRESLFESHVSIREYVERNAMDPAEFIQNNARILFEWHQEGTLERFLADNTYHITTTPLLEYIFSTNIGKQKRSKFNLVNPHPFMVNGKEK